jgi:predicted acylesterase/phospholipase RssA
MSFFATRKLTALYRSLFGDVQIEDLWRPYFCVSTNLSQAEPMIHHSGPLWLAVRASTAIPGIFAPIVYNTDLLVDGGVMNNFPLDVMRNFCGGGLVIGVHPSAPNESERRYAFGPSVSGWRMLWTRINPLTDRIQAPSIFTCLLLVTEVNTRYLRKATPFESLADVLIQPTVGQYNILDFDAYEEIVNIGYESAKEHLDALRNHQKLASLWM